MSGSGRLLTGRPSDCDSCMSHPNDFPMTVSRRLLPGAGPISAVESKKRCLVVSPLISLMNDQVKKLELAGITAAGLHSHAGPHERQRALADWAAKRLRFMYVSPERFSDDGFATALAGSRPDLGCREQKTLPGGVAADQLDERPGQETRARGHHGCRLA